MNPLLLKTEQIYEMMKGVSHKERRLFFLLFEELSFFVSLSLYYLFIYAFACSENQRGSRELKEEMLLGNFPVLEQFDLAVKSFPNLTRPS